MQVGCWFPNTKTTHDFGDVNLSYKFCYVVFIQLVEKHILEMVVNLAITFLFMNLALQLLKYSLEVLIICIFLLLRIMGKRLHVDKTTQIWDIECCWSGKKVLQLVSTNFLILINEMRLLRDVVGSSLTLCPYFHCLVKGNLPC